MRVQAEEWGRIFSSSDSEVPVLTLPAVEEEPMPIPRSLRRWLRLPGRVALILGLGALSTAGARADTPDAGQQAALGDLQIRSVGGNIYLSEGGQEFRLLRLSDTPAARHLKQLVESRTGPGGTVDLQAKSTVLAGGGGSGFYWWGGAHKTADPGKAGASGQADTRKRPASADKTNATATDKKE